MKLLLFFGSGISKPSGYPGVSEIDEVILQTDWLIDRGRNSYHNSEKLPEELKNAWGHRENNTPYLQAFIKRVKEYLNTYYHEKYAHSEQSFQANYEDVYYFLDTLGNEKYQGVEHPFVAEQIKGEWSTLNKDLIFAAYEAIGQSDDTPYIHKHGELAEACKELIRTAVFDALNIEKEPKGLDLILEMSNHAEIDRLDIVTLNHDCLLETLFGNNDIHYFDWLTPKNNHGCRFFIESLNAIEQGLSESKLTLTKPHGSIDWFRCTLNTEEQKLKQGQHRDPHWPYIQHVFELPEILCGSYNKFFGYQAGYFRLPMVQATRLIWSHQTVVISGYGWNDRAMNGNFFDWLDTDPKRKIIILHQDSIEKIANESKGALRWKYEKYQRTGQLIHIPKWLCETTMKDLAPYL